MSKNIIPFETESGDIIYIESDEPAGPVTRGGDPVQGVSGAQPQRFERSMSIISHVGNQIVNRVKSLEMQPDEVSAEIGITFSAKAGNFFLATAGTETSINLTLVWRKKKEE